MTLLNINYTIDESSDRNRGIYIINYTGDGLPTIQKTLTIPTTLSEDDRILMIRSNTPIREWHQSTPQAFPSIPFKVVPVSDSNIIPQ
jgi:hypothetical protein